MSKIKIGIWIGVVVLVIGFLYGIGSYQDRIAPLGFGGLLTFDDAGVTNSSSTVATAASGTVIVAANNGRIYLTMTNSGEYDAYLIFDTLDQLLESMYVGQGLLLTPNQHYEIGPDNLYLGGITAIADATSTVISIIEK